MGSSKRPVSCWSINHSRFWIAASRDVLQQGCSSAGSAPPQKQEGMVWGLRNQNPTKIQAAHELFPGHESIPEAGTSGDVSVCLQHAPALASPCFYCCEFFLVKFIDAPQRASPLLAAEVNDSIPCDSSHLLQCYARVSPARSGQIKTQSCPTGPRPTGRRTVALAERVGGEGIAAPGQGTARAGSDVSHRPRENGLRAARRSPESAVSNLGWFRMFLLMLRTQWTSLGSGADSVGY